MSEQQLEEILDFRKVISMINEELRAKELFDIEYMLVNNSIDEVINVLSDNSIYYNMIKDDKYSNGAKFKDILEMYFQYVKEKYNSLLIPNGKNDRIADKYYHKLKEPTKRNGIYLQYPKSSIDMIQQDVEKTLLLMREAVIAYYKVYHNKKLVAELTTDNTIDSDYLEFIIKEEQLLHLLGVTANQLRNNPDFIRLTGNNHMSSIEILEWIIKDTEGNQDLIQYNEDFLKRISKGNFELSKNQFSNDIQSRILNFHKIRTKSQTFLKYGPFEKVSLVTKIQNGKKLAVNSKSNTAIISRAECFKKYPWAYFGSVQNTNDKYIETLIIDSAEGKKNLFKSSTPAIIKGVYHIGDGPTGGSPSGIGGYGTGAHIFSEEEQFDLFCMAYESFKDTMNFTQLKEYFVDVFNKKINNQEEKNIYNEITSEVFKLDTKSLEMLYNDVLELLYYNVEYICCDENLKHIYQQDLIDKIKYLKADQIYEIKNRILENRYTSQRKRKH